MNHEVDTIKIVTLNLKRQMIMSNSFDYSDTYIHVNATVTVPTTAEAAIPVNNINKNCTPFTICISEINNTQVDDV